MTYIVKWGIGRANAQPFDYPELEVPKMPLTKNTNCLKCGKPLTHTGKFCGRSCSGSSARIGQLIWEQTVAKSMQEDGWTIMSPTACCDRIGIKDGQVFFLEFKPQGNVSLRSFQKAVKDSVPHMYRVVVGTVDGRIAAVTGAGALERPIRRKSTTTSSRYVGVSWNKQKGKWRVRLTLAGTRINVGYFSNEEDAARAYRDELRRQTGLFINENFSSSGPKGPTGQEDGVSDWTPTDNVIN